MDTKTKSKPEAASLDAASATPEPETLFSSPPPDSKIGKVVSLLSRKQGATLAEMTKATGWQPHSVRAALTALRKKGHAITKSKRDDVTCYSIAKAS